MLIKLGIQSKLTVYYEAAMSMSTAAVFKFTPAFTWPSAWPVVVPTHYLYEVRYNKRCSQSWFQVDLYLL